MTHLRECVHRPSSVLLELQSQLATSHGCCCAAFILSRFGAAYARAAKVALNAQLAEDDIVRARP